MADRTLKSFEARNQFIGHLETDIKKNTQLLEDTKQQLLKLQETIANIKTLGQYPEHSSLIPLAKNIYMKGRIVHTGEYYIKKAASPESYIVLKTLEQTLNSLQNDVKVKEKDIEKIKYANFQLQERMRLLKGDRQGFVQDSDESQDFEQDGEDLPNEIKSERGVAVKVGDFYEILEFEEERREK